MSSHIYVEMMGQVYRLTKARYVSWLRMIADGKSPCIMRCGGILLGNIRHVTDWDQSDAEMELADLESEYGE